MKAAVIVMAVLIVVAFGAVVWAIVNPKTTPDNRPVATRPETVSLGLPADCEIVDSTLDGKRLVVRTAGAAAGCARVYLIDTASGQIVATVTR